MVKEKVRVVVVRKWLTFLLFLVVTVAIVWLTIALTGKSYSKVDAEPFRDLRLLIDRLSMRPIPVPIVVALLMPMVMNVLLFVPWGFFAFLLIDRPGRPAHRTYLLTLLVGLGLSLTIEAWQYFLPTRVTDVNDVIWNAAGAFLGAIAGHLRKRVRLVFE
jgi:glycopeptide antibiotics resistance protein